MPAPIAIIATSRQANQSGPLGLIQRDGQRGARGVAITVDVQRTFFPTRDAVPVDDRLHDAHIGLMRNHMVDGAGRETVGGKRLKDRFGSTRVAYL